MSILNYWIEVFDKDSGEEIAIKCANLKTAVWFAWAAIARNLEKVKILEDLGQLVYNQDQILTIAYIADPNIIEKLKRDKE